MENAEAPRPSPGISRRGLLKGAIGGAAAAAAAGAAAGAAGSLLTPDARAA
jgi:hypothetical protein